MDYHGDFQYDNGVLQFIAQPEGYIYKDATGYRYVYQYRDHLGNTRLSFMRNAGTVAIVKETNYYPFGLTHQGYNNLATSLGSAGAKKYQYNGKELLQDDYGLEWYDYGARMYDAGLGRWTVIDNNAEKYSSVSPYIYAANNPIRFLDPDGNKIVDAKGNIIYTQKGGWTKNAPADAMRIGNAMMRTQTGTVQWNKMVNSNTKIQFEISQATLVNGKTYTLGQTIPGEATFDANGKVQLLDAKVVVYEGTINKFMDDTKNSKNDKAVSYQMNTTNNNERIAAVAGHEAEHTTKENVQQNYENQTKGTNYDLEKKPVEQEMKILEETGLNHIKPLETKTIKSIKIVQ